MIPASASLIFLLVALIAIFGPFVLLLIVMLNLKNIKVVFFRRKVFYSLLFGLVFLSDLLFMSMIYSFQKIDAEMGVAYDNKSAREKFTLEIDRPYGELVLPKGTYIDRYDPFDRGEEKRDFRLTGLQYAKFPYPIKIAGLWSSSYRSRGWLQLSKDQVILGEVCEKDRVALFSIPSIEYDIVKEFGEEEPDGVDARFKPSQWDFVKCI